MHPSHASAQCRWRSWRAAAVRGHSYAARWVRLEASGISLWQRESSAPLTALSLPSVMAALQGGSIGGGRVLRRPRVGFEPCHRGMVVRVLQRPSRLHVSAPGYVRSLRACVCFRGTWARVATAPPPIPPPRPCSTSQGSCASWSCVARCAEAVYLRLVTLAEVGRAGRGRPGSAALRAASRLPPAAARPRRSRWGDLRAALRAPLAYPTRLTWSLPSRCPARLAPHSPPPPVSATGCRSRIDQPARRSR